MLDGSVNVSPCGFPLGDLHRSLIPGHFDIKFPYVPTSFTRFSHLGGYDGQIEKNMQNTLKIKDQTNVSIVLQISL